MRASTVVAILSLIAWVALSVALPAIKYAPLSYSICDAQLLSFFADLSVPMSAQYAGNRTQAGVSRAGACPTLAPSPRLMAPRPHTSAKPRGPRPPLYPPPPQPPPYPHARPYYLSSPTWTER
jgi:hypothetical protein